MAKAVVTAGLVALGLAGALFALAAKAGGDGFVVPSSKAAELESCVEPTEYMRRNHFELIEHQRDETVHGGVRSTKHSLADCVACHVGYTAEHQPTPIQDEGQFCSTCHRYAAVSLNCFGCHSPVPNGETWGEIAGAGGPVGRAVALHPKGGLPGGRD